MSEASERPAPTPAKRTPARQKARQLAKHLRAERPDYIYLKEVFRHLRWPTSLPYLFSALRIASTASLLGAIVAEWIGSNKGLGYLILAATYDYRTPLLYATMAVASALALALF